MNNCVDLYEDECKAAGLKMKDVASIARRLSRAAKDAEKLGLKVFGGSGHGTLRAPYGDRWIIVAELEGHFDGGDGGTTEIDGLCTGE